MTWTWDSERRSALASVERSGCGFCVVAHIVSRPVVSSQDATCVRVSIGAALPRWLRRTPSSTWSAAANAASTSSADEPISPPTMRFVPHSGYSSGASSAIASSASRTSGRGSRSTRTASAAARRVALRLGDDRRDGLADVAHPVDRQAPDLGQVPTDRRRVDAGRHGLHERDRLVPREDGHDAGHGACRRRVDPEDAGVGDGAAHEHRVRHPGQDDIAGEGRSTRQVLVAVVLDDGIANQRPTHGRTL